MVLPCGGEWNERLSSTNAMERHAARGSGMILWANLAWRIYIIR
jgi:hypothetical protein